MIKCKPLAYYILYVLSELEYPETLSKPPKRALQESRRNVSHETFSYI